MDLEASGYPISGDAAAHVQHHATEAIAGAVNDAHERIEDAAEAIAATADETTNAAVLSSLRDLHAAVTELASRQHYNPGELTAINESLGRLHARMDAMDAPARESAEAIAATVAAAVETAREEAQDDAETATGAHVEIPDPAELPAGAKKAKKAFFGKKKR